MTGQATRSNDVCRALIVEQDAAAAATLSGVVSGLRAAATVHADARAGWQALRASRFDLLILGFALAGQAGSDLIQRFRSAACGMHRDARIPILVVADDGSEATRMEALERGADQFVSKPLNPALVAALVRSLLRAAPKPGPGRLQLDLEQGLLLRGGSAIQLAGAQMEIFVALARAGDRALSREQLAASCSSRRLSATALEAHIQALRKHLGPHAIQAVRGGRFQLLAEVERQFSPAA